MFSEILERAMAHGKEQYPDAPAQHHAAFANAVSYLVTGVSGGYGGPSMREHACSFLAHTSGKMPCSYAEALRFCEPHCFGPLTSVHIHACSTQHCFDDAPCDLEEVKKRLN